MNREWQLDGRACGHLCDGWVALEEVVVIPDPATSRADEGRGKGRWIRCSTHVADTWGALQAVFQEGKGVPLHLLLSSVPPA